MTRVATPRCERLTPLDAEISGVLTETGYGWTASSCFCTRRADTNVGNAFGTVPIVMPTESRRVGVGRPADTVTAVLIVLPALNEEGSVAQVVAEVRAAQPDAAILVVDDGSTDRTAVAARSAGADVLRLPFNLGVGGAMRAAFRYARAHGVRYVVQVDADGQHDPEEIAMLLAAAQSADVVVGARFAGRGTYQARGPRRWAMRILGFTLSKVIGVRLTDPTSGFRVAGPRAIPVFAQHYPEEYLGDTVESLVIAHRVGLRIAQVPVQMRARAAGKASQSAFRATMYLSRVGIAVLLALLREVPATDQRDLLPGSAACPG